VQVDDNPFGKGIQIDNISQMLMKKY